MDQQSRVDAGMLARVRIPLTASEWDGLFAGHPHIIRGSSEATRGGEGEIQAEPDDPAAQRLYERRGYRLRGCVRDRRPLLRLPKSLSGMGEAA
jgi:hypothetical protein